MSAIVEDNDEDSSDCGDDSSDCGDDNPGELLAIEQLREMNEAMKV